MVSEQVKVKSIENMTGEIEDVVNGQEVSNTLAALSTVLIDVIRMLPVEICLLKTLEMIYNITSNVAKHLEEQSVIKTVASRNKSGDH